MSMHLRSLLGNPAQTLAALPGGVEVAAILAARRAALASTPAQLTMLGDKLRLARQLTALCSSYITSVLDKEVPPKQRKQETFS